MSFIKIIFLLFFLWSCNQTTVKKVSDKKTEQVNSSSTDKVRQFSQDILAGKQITLESAYLRDRIFDSINSALNSSRSYYLDISIFLLKRGDAFMSSTFSSNLSRLLMTNPDEFFSKIGKYDDQLVIDLGVTLDYYLSKKDAKTNGTAAEVRKIFRSSLDHTDSATKEKVKLILKHI